LKTLNRRAESILKARPAYEEMVAFYRKVFECQIEWRDKLVVRPEATDADGRHEALRDGRPLAERYDPGIDSGSLQSLWVEMKGVFVRGNPVLREAVQSIERAEAAGDFAAGTWLLELRPDRQDLVTDTASGIDIDESVLATLARAVTLPHWEAVACSWLRDYPLDEWRRSRCPACGGPPGLVENRKGRAAGEGLTAGPRRFMHCPFCAARWVVPSLECPACGSKKPGDAKYLYSPDEPDLRIDFCKSCRHYIKVVDGDKISGSIHVGLELLAAAHLDVIAQDKELSPVEAYA
jgi:FdhE protein